MSIQNIRRAATGVALASTFALTSAHANPVTGAEAGLYSFPMLPQQVIALERKVPNKDCPEKIWDRLRTDDHALRYMFETNGHRLNDYGVSTLLFMCHFEHAVQKPKTSRKPKDLRRSIAPPMRG